VVIPLNVYFKIPLERLTEFGVFNAYMGIDNKVFVDPSLLRNSKIPEFENATQKIAAYFTPIIKLLKITQKTDDIAWQEAFRRLQFKEEQGAALGYSGVGSSGRGIGPRLAKMLVFRGTQIVRLGIEDPEMFELIGLFQEHFGPDLLSDMAVSILKQNFLMFTERVTTKLNLTPKKEFRFKAQVFTLPVYPDGKSALVFVPADFLTPLPIALDENEIYEVAKFNAEVRARWNEIIASATKENRTPSKAEIRKMLLESPQNLSDLITVYKRAARKGYDFAKDPFGLFSWDYIGRTAAGNFPLEIARKHPENIRELREVLNLIILQFKKNIEENKLYEVLYGETGKPRQEVFSQRLFYAIADTYCMANNVDLNREPNAGNGPVDFKLSAGYDARVLVEIKKSSNGDLLHGFEIQLSAYEKAEATRESVYLILRVSDNEVPIKDVIALRASAAAKGARVPDIVVIDARKRLPASKRKK
jgi:hypothetical protein